MHTLSLDLLRKCSLYHINKYKCYSYRLTHIGGHELHHPTLVHHTQAGLGPDQPGPVLGTAQILLLVVIIYDVWRL